MLSEPWTCPACGFQPETEDEKERHEKGVDAKRLACAHQDIEAINALERPRHSTFNGQVW